MRVCRSEMRLAVRAGKPGTHSSSGPLTARMLCSGGRYERFGLRRFRAARSASAGACVAAHNQRHQHAAPWRAPRADRQRRCRRVGRQRGAVLVGRAAGGVVATGANTHERSREASLRGDTAQGEIRVARCSGALAARCHERRFSGGKQVVHDSPYDTAAPRYTWTATREHSSGCRLRRWRQMRRTTGSSASTSA